LNKNTSAFVKLFQQLYYKAVKMRAIMRARTYIFRHELVRIQFVLGFNFLSQSFNCSGDFFHIDSAILFI
jgi:hypothetical protein